MKDEINEKIKAYYIGNDIDKLLDYITNLQEENERYRTANNTLCEVEDFMYNQAKEYKSRIDKAVEYINKSEYATIESYKHIHADNEGKVYNLDVLLNILKGDDNNE